MKKFIITTLILIAFSFNNVFATSNFESLEIFEPFASEPGDQGGDNNTMDIQNRAYYDIYLTSSYSNVSSSTITYLESRLPDMFKIVYENRPNWQNDYYYLIQYKTTLLGDLGDVYVRVYLIPKKVVDGQSAWISVKYNTNGSKTLSYSWKGNYSLFEFKADSRLNLQKDYSNVSINFTNTYPSGMIRAEWFRSIFYTNVPSRVTTNGIDYLTIQNRTTSKVNYVPATSNTSNIDTSNSNISSTSTLTGVLFGDGIEWMVTKLKEAFSKVGDSIINGLSTLTVYEDISSGLLLIKSILIFIFDLLLFFITLLYSVIQYIIVTITKITLLLPNIVSGILTMISVFPSQIAGLFYAIISISISSILFSFVFKAFNSLLRFRA